MSLSLLARRWVAKLPACFRSNATSQSPAVIFEGMFRLNHLEEGLTRTKEERAGYFPAALDQSLANGRYTILRKLGWGTAASVWLAKDEKQQSHVALKIMTAFWTEKQGAYEELILSRVKTANTDHPGRAYLPQLLDGFDVESHHGKHRVLVTDVSGPSLHALRHDHLPKKSLLPSSILKQWLRELLLALDYLHTEVGVIHSDIRLPNILLDFPKSEDSLLQAVHDEPPKFYPTDTKLQGPVPTFVSQPFPVPSDIIDGHTPVPSVKLIDLGGANWVENHTWHTCHNEDMRAPEVILRHPWGPPADIRALCCVLWFEWPVFSLAGANAPLEVEWEDFNLQQMMHYAGHPFSPSFLSECKRRDEFFDQEGNLKHVTPPEASKIISVAEGMQSAKIPDAEMKLASDFIAQGMALDPRDRATAAELLQHAWLQRCS